MPRYYHANPADTSDITGPYQDGQTNVQLPDGRVISRITEAVPAWDLYEAIEDNTPTPAYNNRDPDTLTFSGTIQGDDGRVTEMRNFSQWPIGEVYEVKRRNVFDQDRAVRYNAVDTSLSANWWMICTEELTTEIIAIGLGSNTRQINGQNWPAGPNAPWLGIYNQNTTDSRRYQITDQGTWDTLEQEWALHLQATGNATDASRSALDAAYADGAGVWEDVAAHDPADPAWGYPPTVDPAELQAAVG